MVYRQFTYTLLTIFLLLTHTVQAKGQTSLLPERNASAPTASASAQPSVTLKTNVLYLTALVPNAEVEVRLPNNLSFNLELEAAWWDSYHKAFFYRLLVATPEIRYWLTQKAHIRGHYVGIYGGIGQYDFMMGTNNVGLQGTFWHAGASYGYLFPLNAHLALELGIGAGILRTTYSEYKRCNDGCYGTTMRKRTTWFGPTKAEINLVWTIGKKGKRP